MVEQEALFGSIPSPSKSAKKNFRPSMGGLTNKRLLLGGSMLQTPYAGKAALSSRLSSSLNQQTPQSGRLVIMSSSVSEFTLSPKILAYSFLYLHVY